MGRRIIGQCNTCDFLDLAHLADVTQVGQVFDLNNLTNRQKAAIQVVRHFQMCGVPFKVTLKIREVLIWELPDKGLAFEYKLKNPGDDETRTTLTTMAPKKVNLDERRRKNR